MSWRIARSLAVLLAEINAAYPGRDTRTDGAISGYPGSISSHNVNSEGVVCAIDITTGDYPGGISTAQGMALAEQVRIAMRDQPRGLPCYPIHHMEPPYVPYAGPWIATVNRNWDWQPYGGADGHTSHLHISADWDIYAGGSPSGLADYDLTLPWNISTLNPQGGGYEIIQEDTMTPDQEAKLDAVLNLLTGGQAGVKPAGDILIRLMDIQANAQSVKDSLTPGQIGVRNAGTTVLQLAQINAQLAGQAAAVESLSKASGIDPGVVTKTISDAVNKALSTLTVTIEGNTK